MVPSVRIPIVLFLMVAITSASLPPASQASEDQVTDPDFENTIFVESYEALAELILQRAKDVKTLTESLDLSPEIGQAVQHALASFEEAWRYWDMRDSFGHADVAIMWEYATKALLILRHSQKELLAEPTLSLELVEAVQEDISTWTDETKKMANQITSDIWETDWKNMKMSVFSRHSGKPSAGSSTTSGSGAFGYIRKLFRRSDRASAGMSMVNNTMKHVVSKLVLESILTKPRRRSSEAGVNDKQYASRMLRIAAKAAFLHTIARQLSNGGFANYGEHGAQTLLNKMIVLGHMTFEG